MRGFRLRVNGSRSKPSREEVNMHITKALLGSAAAVGLMALTAQSASAATVRVYVTNSGGDNIHVVDPATHKVESTIEGIEVAHGVAFSPDGTRVYVSNEPDHTVDVFDRQTGKLSKKVKLSGRPNNIAVAKDG